LTKKRSRASPSLESRMELACPRLAFAEPLTTNL